MKRVILLFSLVALIGNAFAKNYDLFFHDDNAHGLCVSQLPHDLYRRNINDLETCAVSLSNDVRVRVVNPQINKDQKYGFDVVRPIFILDGIYLSTDTLRNLDGFHEETLQFGLTDVLTELGYTPILVQFSETVRTSLIENAMHFANLLHFVSENKFFGFPNKMEDGMIVFGISQGGVIGRYGAYTYDVIRKVTDAPIRLFGSLDSPHQGAIMPKGLFYTINFWAKNGGSSDAEAFSDLVSGPGASDLLITNVVDSVAEEKVYAENFSDGRFLFGEYRKAAEYKKYPSVLISQGQIKGTLPIHSKVYYKLNRKASKLGVVVGRAQSEIGDALLNDGHLIAFNRIYRMMDDDIKSTISDSLSYDFVQGSTYPFAKKMYESLRSGFEDAMPEGMRQDLPSSFGLNAQISLATSWDEDTLMQANSTFIPTTSALDLRCENDFSMRKHCAFSSTYSDVFSENSGDKNSAISRYAVDVSHPRYKESISGRHIELPVHSSGAIDTTVLHGMQVDIWRFLCEVAKNDYDETKSTFRNESLTGIFDPKADCMDLSYMPEILRYGGFKNVKTFAYARYDYNKVATELDESVSFDVPAGWHKVAVFDNGTPITLNGNFVVDVRVDNAKSSWMKAELMLATNKSGSGQLQLQELNVPVDGAVHTLKWNIDFAENASSHYRWLRLVLNSDGGSVTFSNPRFERNVANAEIPPSIESPIVFPNEFVQFFPWAESTILLPYSDALGLGLNANFKAIGAGFYMDLSGKKSLNNYRNVKILYWPGTCQGTSVYFDSFRKNMVSLKNGVAVGLLEGKTIPLSSIINTSITPNGELAASRLVFQSTKNEEQCFIHDVILE